MGGACQYSLNSLPMVPAREIPGAESEPQNQGAGVGPVPSECLAKWTPWNHKLLLPSSPPRPPQLCPPGHSPQSSEKPSPSPAAPPLLSRHAVRHGLGLPSQHRPASPVAPPTSPLRAQGLLSLTCSIPKLFLLHTQCPRPRGWCSRNRGILRKRWAPSGMGCLCGCASTAGWTPKPPRVELSGSRAQLLVQL